MDPHHDRWELKLSLKKMISKKLNKNYVSYKLTIIKFIKIISIEVVS